MPHETRNSSFFEMYKLEHTVDAGDCMSVTVDINVGVVVRDVGTSLGWNCSLQFLIYASFCNSWKVCSEFTGVGTCELLKRTVLYRIHGRRHEHLTASIQKLNTVSLLCQELDGY